MPVANSPVRVEQFVPLARAIAHRAARHRVSGGAVDDLVGAAFEGLVVAAARYEPGRGVPFRAYAKHRIEGAVLDSIRSWDWVPRTVRERSNRLEDARRRVRLARGRDATRPEVAQFLGVTEREVTTMESTSDVRGLMSLDAPFDDSGSSLREVVPDDKAAVDPVDDKEVRRDLAAALADLPEREHTAVVAFFLRGRPLKEIGQELGVSESRVSQLCTQGVARLRKALAAHR